jgi:hypothetical protein
MLFVDHNIKSEDDLQYSVYSVNNTTADKCWEEKSEIRLLEERKWMQDTHLW